MLYFQNHLVPSILTEFRIKISAFKNFQNSKVLLFCWFRLRCISRKTFNFIESKKSVNFKFRFWRGPTTQHLSPLSEPLQRQKALCCCLTNQRIGRRMLQTSVWGMKHMTWQRQVAYRGQLESQKKLGVRRGMLSVILCMCASNSTRQDRNVIFTTFLLIVR
jgi:hypothetical protein